MANKKIINEEIAIELGKKLQEQLEEVSATLREIKNNNLTTTITAKQGGGEAAQMTGIIEFELNNMQLYHQFMFLKKSQVTFK